MISIPPLADWVGYAAATLTTLSFVPQAWLTLRTKDVSGISMTMYACFTAGIALWLCYGWVLGQRPIIVANAVTLVLASIILGTKVSVEWRRRRPDPRPGPRRDQNGLPVARETASDASRVCPP